MENEITVIFVSFHSDHIIEKSIVTIDKNIKIIIVENSLNYKFKNKIEKKYQNIKVIIPERNMGNGAGINIGLKNTKTKYAFYLDVDTELFPDTIKSLYHAAKEVGTFSILAPKINNFDYKNDCYLKQSAIKKYSNMRFVTGCALFFKLEIFDEVGFFDEKIFLYYEENDFYERCLSKKKYIFLIENSKINHKGNSSVNEKYKDEIEINRNWHLMWSTFYFYKKHFGVIKAFVKILPKFTSAFLKFMIFFLINNKKKRDIYYARFNGSLNSIIGKKSWFRPKITN
jgi:N-acetylglucosaminyl-diphospho-decaprenol L-rhamnosyltransferase